VAIRLSLRPLDIRLMAIRFRLGASLDVGLVAIRLGTRALDVGLVAVGLCLFGGAG